MVLKQQTLKNRIPCQGLALHCGRKINVRLMPGEEDTGILFRRMDLFNGARDIVASWKNVSCSKLATTLSNEHGASVSTVEHLMAALAGCGIDNAIIEVDGPELPILDGSAAQFVFLIECAGIVAQNATRKAIKVLKQVSVGDENKSLTISPAPEFSIDFTIDFADAAIRRQQHHFEPAGSSFRNEIARARTFGLEPEIEAMRKAGFARGGSLKSAIVVKNGEVLNTEGLRYDNEFVRHKILDCIGDLYLAGKPIIGAVEARLSGHELNNLLSHKLMEDEKAWTLVDAHRVQ